MFTLHTHQFVHASHRQDAIDHSKDAWCPMEALLAKQPRAHELTNIGTEIISQSIKCSLIHRLAIGKWIKGQAAFGPVSFIIKSQEASPRPLDIQGYLGWSQWSLDASSPEFQMPGKSPLENCWSGSTWMKQTTAWIFSRSLEVNSNPLAILD